MSKKIKEETAIGYIRVSTDDQKLGAESQLSEIRKWCDHRKIKLISYYEDIGISGASSVDKRPGLLNALHDLKKFNAKYLIALKRDRFARDTLVIAQIKASVNKLKAKLITTDGNSDNEGPAADMMDHMLDGFAQFERAMIKERTKRALNVKREKNEALGGIPPIGFDKQGKDLVKNEYEQDVLDLIYRLLDEGTSLRKVAEQLNNKKILPRGEKWHHTTIARISKRRK